MTPYGSGVMEQYAECWNSDVDMDTDLCLCGREHVRKGHPEGLQIELPCACGCDRSRAQADGLETIMGIWHTHEKKYGHKHENMRELGLCPDND